MQGTPILGAITSTSTTTTTISPKALTPPRPASVLSNHQVPSAATLARHQQRRAPLADSVHQVPATRTYPPPLPPLHLTILLQILKRNVAGIHMELKDHTVSPLHRRSPHRHTRGIIAWVRLALGTVSAHQRRVPNPSRLISARGRNANWWVIKPSPFLIPILYHLCRLSPPSPPLHHIPPIIQFHHSPKHPSFRWIVVLLLLLLCLRIPRRRLMYRRCFLPPARPSPCRATRAMGSQYPG